MTILDYGTLLSPKPIKLSIGSLRKPKLLEIYDISFERFISYESILKLTPEMYYTELLGEDGKKQWNSFSKEQRNDINIYDIITNDISLQNMYVEIFNYFFVESVVFENPYFVFLNEGTDLKQPITKEDITGVISKNTFSQVICMIQQTCCIFEKPKPSIDEQKFKNNIARKLYEKMLKAQEENEKRMVKKGNKDHSLPNIISAVSNRHPCINPNTVWDLTVFQLIDSFNRLQVNAVYEINQTRVSVWGDEKKAFDSTLWYKNSHDN